MDVAEKIRDDVRDGMEKTQREFLLRQQLAAIRKELGEGEPEGADDYRTRVEEADLPDKVREAALREVGRLERASDQSPESGWIRTWLDTVLEIPWQTAHRGQHRHHRRPRGSRRRPPRAGRRQGPDRGVPGGPRAGGPTAACRSSAAAAPAPCWLLVGPPGVGKTSLGECVARALGRKFVRVALGGVRDEAEIRGHRRTYVGALPGRIVRASRRPAR